MEKTLKSRFDIGDRVITRKNFNYFTEYEEASIINVRYDDGFEYLIDFADGQREWICEALVYPTKNQKITVRIVADNVGVLDKIKEMFK